MQYRNKQAPGLSCRLSQLMARTHQNVAVVAPANKLLHMAWAVLCKKEDVSDSGAGYSTVRTERDGYFTARSAGGLLRWHNGRTGAF
jgi:hypothetical protein